MKIKEWEKESPGDKFYFRPFRITSDNEPGMQDEVRDIGKENMESDVIQIQGNAQKNSLLLVHQTKWQSNLLNKYGGEICFLDATYKTSRLLCCCFFHGPNRKFECHIHIYTDNFYCKTSININFVTAIVRI